MKLEKILGKIITHVKVGFISGAFVLASMFSSCSSTKEAAWKSLEESVNKYKQNHESENFQKKKEGVLRDKDKAFEKIDGKTSSRKIDAGNSREEKNSESKNTQEDSEIESVLKHMNNAFEKLDGKKKNKNNALVSASKKTPKREIYAKLERLIRTAKGYEFMFRKGEPKDFSDWDDLVKEGVDYAYYKLVLPIDEDSIRIHRYRISGESTINEEIGHRISKIDQNKFLKALKDKLTSDSNESYDEYDYTKIADIVRMTDLNVMHSKQSCEKKYIKDAEKLLDFIKKNINENIPKISKWEKAPKQEKYNFVRTILGYRLKINGYKVFITSDDSGNIYLMNNEKSFEISFDKITDYLDSKYIKKDWIKPVGPHVSLDRSDSKSQHLVDVLDSMLLNFYTKPSQKDLEKGCGILKELKNGIKKYLDKHSNSLK